MNWTAASAHRERIAPAGKLKALSRHIEFVRSSATDNALGLARRPVSDSRNHQASGSMCAAAGEATIPPARCLPGPKTFHPSPPLGAVNRPEPSMGEANEQAQLISMSNQRELRQPTHAESGRSRTPPSPRSMAGASPTSPFGTLPGNSKPAGDSPKPGPHGVFDDSHLTTAVLFENCQLSLELVYLHV